MAATIEGQDRVMATAQQIVKSLNTSKDDTKDMLLIFSNFDNRLSNISSLLKTNDSRLDAAERVILQWDSNPSGSCFLWEDSPDKTAEFLNAVDEIIQLTEDLANLSDNETMDRAEIAIQVAMARLEEEFRAVLTRNTAPLDPESLQGSIRRVSLSFAANDGEIGGFEALGEDYSVGYCHERGRSLGGDFSVELINPDAVIDLREIADRMIRSGYEKECCQVYSSVRRDALDECLSILGVERLSIEEVQKIEWRILDEKMKKWVQAVKLASVLLNSEKHLCEQIFDNSELIKQICFVETAKGSVMQLLNFGEAVAIGRRSSEKLFRILDMYDALARVLPDLTDLFSDELGEIILSEARGVMSTLGEAAIGTLAEFESAVQGESSRKPINGEIHPLTRYVMNYVKLLVDYSDSLNTLLENNSDEHDIGNIENLSLEGTSRIGLRITSLIKSLEMNLEEKSKTYEESGMPYVFLMNNILYIVQKVKDSELGKLLGDNWVRKRRGQVRQYATSYLRSAWSNVLSCLRDVGMTGSSNSSVSKMALKERFKNFNVCFEEIYRVQTAWKVPDDQLREELRITISDNVLPAYRAFLWRFGNQLESGRHSGKYIKYSPEDLEQSLSDLFEGVPGFLHHMRRKSA
ncbi:exocyst complex component EXO70B1 [Impatiens glandulifera]|uniref:exocyst complex component EXO70B1 n=1 Tax=Impatiens glandulifera TaxID=253017 RepID=UPI001FB13BCD|nr:exocyst complex component EXO70B1 [Impatiens glandulifera]